MERTLLRCLFTVLKNTIMNISIDRTIRKFVVFKHFSYKTLIYKQFSVFCFHTFVAA